MATARSLLEKALGHAPADQRARNLLGLSLFKLGELEKAEGIYRGLIEDHPADPTLRVNLGLVFLKRGASADAAKCFTTALDLQPEHTKAQNYLGLAFAQKGEHAQARDWFVRSGNAQMAERMTSLLKAHAAREAAAYQQASLTQPAVSEPPKPVRAYRDTGEFARVPPRLSGSPNPFANPSEDPADTAEFSRSPLAASTWNAPALPTPVAIPRIPTTVAPALPTWPPPPSGSSIEGAHEAMQRVLAADTDPSLAPLTAAQLAPVSSAPISSPSLPAPPIPAVATTASLSMPLPPGTSPGIMSPLLATQPSAPPSFSQSSAGTPKSVEPVQLSSYTSQRRLEMPGAESSFAIGSAEVVIQVRGEMLTRLDGLVASWGSATVRSELKRFRGKATDKPFGDGARRMLRISGEGRYVVSREGRVFTPLELGDEPAYFREEVLFAFEESLVFENGRVPSKVGGDLHLVHLRGRGRLLLVSAGEPRSVDVRKGEPLRIPMDQLVGWHGPLIQPRVVPIVEETPELGIALELSGEGSALVDAPDS